MDMAESARPFSRKSGFWQALGWALVLLLVVLASPAARADDEGLHKFCTVSPEALRDAAIRAA
jgi:hypothetical protein